MKWQPRFVILFFLALIVGVPVVMNRVVRLTGSSTGMTGPGEKLTILTPHGEQIRYEFGRAFNLWRQQQGRTLVQLDWRASGGTSDLRRLVFDQFNAKISQGREDEGIESDLFFGGGAYEHGRLARGITTYRDGQTVSIPLSVPVQMPQGLLEQVYPQPNIGSEPLYDPQLRWLGVVLSSFGIVYNRDTLRGLGLDTPRQWSDLVDGRYLRWVALADPAHSGSIAATYNAILRREGWDEGWKLLRRVFANARYFTSSASKVPVDVSSGEAAAGMCIDFYGRFQSGAIGGDRVGYVDPRHMTAVTADPVSILRGAPNLDLANQFVLWLLSPAAQNLWQKKRHTPGGPERFELRRLPIRRDLYAGSVMQQWVDDVQPFEIARAFPDGMPNFYAAIAPLAHVMAIDVHADLQAAWQAIVDQRDPRIKQLMVEQFDAMPQELRVRWPDSDLALNWRGMLENPNALRHAEVRLVLRRFMDSIKQRMKDRELFYEDRLRWGAFFRAQYRQTVRIARAQ